MTAYFAGYVIRETGTITVSDTAVAATASKGSLSIANHGSDTIYIGATSAVTVDDGYPLYEGQDTLIQNTVYLIAATGATPDVRYAMLGGN